jgi:hypothetical protein
MKKQLSKQSTNSPFCGFRGLVALLLFPLWGLGGWGLSLSAQTINITPIGANYDNKTVTFSVSWDRPFVPNDSVWVWIDFCPIAGVTPGTFGTATISAVAPATATASTSTRGFFVTANPATVTATLNTTQTKFNWCAYGSGAPPKAERQPDGSYLLKGTSPFTITYNDGSSTTTSENTFHLGCITTITDATGNPAGIIPPLPDIQLSAGNNSQTIFLSKSINPIEYTTTDAINVIAADLPDGVSGLWLNNTYTISGTPTIDGSFNYTLTTTNNSNCPNATDTGTIIVIGTPEGSGTQTWTCGSLTWSGILHKAQAGCSPATVLLATDASALYLEPGICPGSGFLYNAQCVAEYGSDLCPEPWRVPTYADFAHWVECALGVQPAMTIMKFESDPATLAAWGYVATGIMTHGYCLEYMSACYAYTVDGWLANVFEFYTPGFGHLQCQHHYEPDVGLSLRCVK